MPPADLNRRRFLKMGLDKRTYPVRPPWAVAENAFQDTCSRCGDCIAVCPEKILVREGINGFPQVDFKLGECTFCGKCADHCPTTALEYSRSTPWMIKAHITESCLAIHQVVCSTCSEQCEVDAIRFKPRAGLVARPEVYVDSCTGCGACVAPCPVQAVGVYP